MKKGTPGQQAKKETAAGNRAAQERTAAAAKPSQSKRRASANFARHRRKCTVCLHPDRVAIDQDFIDWHSVAVIGQFYGLTPRAIYRHAQAAGLFERRTRNIRFALGSLIEKINQVEVTAGSVIRAIRTCAMITDDGRWVEEPVVVHHSSSSDPSAPSPTSPSKSLRPAAPASAAVAPDSTSFCPQNPKSLIVTADDRKSA